ncbi:MAG: hypothetical protein HOV81_34550 [Kofleriaceae bacterium]|nr:hypothetical protein [Kofleriaceae bacterium]
MTSETLGCEMGGMTKFSRPSVSTRRAIARLALAGSTLGALASFGCGGDDGANQSTGTNYALASVVIDPDGNRTTYVQTIESLDAGPFDNGSAIELPGNGVVMTHGKDIFVGMAEEPTWVRYTAGETGIAETGRLSLLNTGATYIDYGYAIVDDTTAISVISAVPSVVVWNPQTMEIKGEIPLPHLVREGYELEVWTTAEHDGLVYIPGRWADWTGGKIFPGVSMTIVDPKTMTVVAHAEDDRCASGGRPVFDAAGNAYVMGDGRTYSIQMFANASGGTAPDNCLLRIKKGATDFDPNYFYTLPSLTGGLQSITELDTAADGTGIAFAKMFYPDKLPADVKPVDFAFWDMPAHKTWRLHLTEPPTAEEVEGAPFSTIGFKAAAVDGRLFSPEAGSPSTSDVYEIDPAANTATLRFQMDGYFYGIYKLE